MTERTIMNRKTEILAARKLWKKEGHNPSEGYLNDCTKEIFGALGVGVIEIDFEMIEDLVYDGTCIVMACKDIIKSASEKKIQEIREKIQPTLKAWKESGISLDSITWHDDGSIEIRFVLL